MMAIRVIDGEDEIRRILAEFCEQLKIQTGNNFIAKKWNDEFWVDHINCRFSVARGAWPGIQILDPVEDKSLLQCTFYSPKTGASRVAGCLIDDSGVIKVLHDGRVTPQDHRPKPNWNKKIELEDKIWNDLGPLDGIDAVEALYDYHLSRGDKRFGHKTTSFRSGPTTNSGYDFGPGNNSKRSSSIARARHNPICRALEMAIGQCEVLTPEHFSPDLYLRKNGTTFLIEVKPDSGLSSICTALGQLKIYTMGCENNHSYLVCPQFAENEKYKKVSNLLAKEEISILTFSQDGSEYTFTDQSKKLLDSKSKTVKLDK